MAQDFSQTHEQLINVWCALADHSTRKQRLAVTSAAALKAYWRGAGKPVLPRRLQHQLQAWLADGGRVLFRWSADFPHALAQIPDPPAALFVRGDVSVFRRRRVAIVGSRAASHGGLAVARRLATQLSEYGVLVVSGLAQGIDCAAHEGALAAGHSTLAIPGSGLGNLYPRKHQRIAQHILQSGGLLASEYAPWVSPRKSSFPARNRIISGVCSGVVVVQAAQRSGSLITARLAAEQGREVMAVPGAPGLPVSAGCNQLLRDGAALIEGAGDVLDALGWPQPEAASAPDATIGAAGGGAAGGGAAGGGAAGKSTADESTAGSAPAASTTQPSLSAEARRVLERLDGEAVIAQQLGADLGLSPSALDGHLLELQLCGLVQATPRGYIRAP